MKKKRWLISGHLTVSILTEVEASTLEEAKKIAQKRDVQGLCSVCSTGDEKVEWSLNGELDGEPEVVEDPEAHQELD